MSGDLDDILQSLEKQVNDFTLDIHHEKPTHTSSTRLTNTTRAKIPTSTSHSELTRKVSRTRKVQLDSDDDDDDAVIGNLISKPTSPKSIGLARSLSSSGKKFPKALLPEEPVPSLPSILPPSNTTPTTPINTSSSNNNNSNSSNNNNDDDDLRQAMQLAWAVLDSDPVNSNSVETPSKNEQIETKQEATNTTLKHSTSLHNNMHQHRSSPQNTVTVTMTTRIFIEDGKTYKTVQLTNLLTAAMVIQYLKRKDLLDNNDDWTIFEIANSHGIERPLRLWEIVTDTTSCWEQHTKNALLVKRYGFYDSLTADSLRDRILPVHGWLNIEYKKGKWQKRYCFIKDNAIHHAKDNKCSGASLLCSLNSFDVYTTLHSHSSSPTPFVFVLRAQEKASIYEKEEDYIRYFTAENQNAMEDWVIGIRLAKSMSQYQQYPKRVLNPLAAITTQGSNQEGVRRHKSLKKDDDNNTGDSNMNGRSRGYSQGETVKRKASTRGLSRNGTLRHRDDQQNEINDNNNNTDDNNGNNTLIHIDPKVQFSKGSLLEKAEAPLPISSSPNNNNINNINNSNNNQVGGGGGGLTRSKSTRDYSSSSNLNNSHRSRGDDTVLSHHTSIRRKERPKPKDHHDVPLPNTTSIMTSTSSNPVSTTSKSHSNNTTLLQLDNTPERFHTQTLLQRQMKPLINFDKDYK